MVRWPARRGRSRIGASRRRVGRWLRDALLTVVILGLFALLAARLDTTQTYKPEGRAIINDGDTITIGSERIRLRGIDAPEQDQICNGDGGQYPCGRRSREALIALIGGRHVSCNGWERDRYGRLLATCTAGGTDLNGGLVSAGWAVAYGGYRAEEAAARDRSAGIWAGTFDQPADWRKMHGITTENEPGDFIFLDWLRDLLRLS